MLRYIENSEFSGAAVYGRMIINIEVTWPLAPQALSMSSHSDDPPEPCKMPAATPNICSFKYRYHK